MRWLVGEVKAIEPQDENVSSPRGLISGIASVIGVVDLRGDTIEQGAFDKTLQERPIVPILWQHDEGLVIGRGTLKLRGRNLTIDGELDMDDPVAVRAFDKIRKGLVTGLSIGYQTIKEQWAANGAGRRLTEVKVWEVSVVTFAMNLRAQITDVNAMPDSLIERIGQLQEQITALSAKLDVSTEPQIVTRAEPEPVHSSENIIIPTWD